MEELMEKSECAGLLLIAISISALVEKAASIGATLKSVMRVECSATQSNTHHARR
jgi:hypothetical protein